LHKVFVNFGQANFELDAFGPIEWWYKQLFQTYKAVAGAAINNYGSNLLNPYLPQITRNLFSG
jgi:hypothetical protein